VRYDVPMDLIAEFLRHNTMMNERLLEACRPLTAEQLGTSVAGTYGTVGATLVHIVNSQVGYVPRFLLADKPPRLPEDPFPGFDALTERMGIGNRLLEDAAARAGEGHEIRLSGNDPPATWRMPAALVLLQAVNHGTEHRSQIATILTRLGVEPPAMDGWTYFLAAGLMTETTAEDPIPS
jgi:uncharacterized damage-inducible protein DinB